MRKSLFAFMLLSLVGCITPTAQSDKVATYNVLCATSLGHEMISGRFSQVEVLDGGALSLVSDTGRRVIVTGFCIAVEMR